MSFTVLELVAHLNALGLRRGDAVVVHSSCRRIGETEGGAAGVIDALVQTVLPGGAILFPNLYMPHGFTVDNPPRFNLREDSVRQTLGILPEVFKFEYATHFSIHPTHSMMGTGELAPDILRDHEKAGVPCGIGTPWHRNALHVGKVLLVGVDQKCNTTYHCAEEQLEDSYQLTDDIIDGVVVDGGEHIVVPSRLHVWDAHPNFNVINPELERRGYLTAGVVGQAPALCLDAAGFLKVCLEKLNADTRYFLRDSG